MSVYQLSNDELLTLARRVVENAQASDAISSAVAPYGYNEAAFQEGTARTDAFAAALQERQDTYGRQQGATDALGDAWDAFHEKTYMPHVTIARLVFVDGTRGRLGIDGRRPRSFDAYLQEAQRFYATLSGDGDLQAQIAARGITAEKVTTAQSDLGELEALDQERLKAEAQEATRQRVDARRAAADWVADFQKIARIALADQPDLVEQLGLAAPSA